MTIAVITIAYLVLYDTSGLHSDRPISTRVMGLQISVSDIPISHPNGKVVLGSDGG